MKDDLRARLLALSIVLVALVLACGPVEARAVTAGSAHAARAQGTVSTLVIDRTVDAPANPPPRSHWWVGVVVGVFGVLGLVWSRAFKPASRAGSREAGPSA